MDVATLVTTLVIAIVGLYLTHSLRRQQSLKIAEQRLAAYRPLWELRPISAVTIAAAVGPILGSPRAGRPHQ